ncbi:MAG: hypothetical protein LBL84_00855 [Candidatus Nomurabacteria bacterium]|jgi:hypothetical protein|nr:hypothetical protein [Candidatus Nomurabacteria bacterium]
MKKLRAKLKKLGARGLVAELVYALGRIGLFLGFVNILLAVLLFVTGNTISSGTTSQTGSSGGGAVASLGPVVSTVVAVVSIVAVVLCFIYMFYSINKWTKYAINLIARYTKSALLMLEFSLSLMVYALSAALLASTFPDYMNVVLTLCGGGAAVTLICFVAAHIIIPKKAQPKAAK